MSETKLEFDIAPVQIPVRIDGQGYVMSKASAAAAARWRSELLKLATLGEDGSVKAIGPEVAELDFPLLAACLRHAMLDEDGNVRELKEHLTVEEVRELPNDAVIPLAERLKKISAMDVTLTKDVLLKQKAELEEQLAALDAGDPVKNSPSTTTDGSD